MVDLLEKSQLGASNVSSSESSLETTTKKSPHPIFVKRKLPEVIEQQTSNPNFEYRVTDTGINVYDGDKQVGQLSYRLTDDSKMVVDHAGVNKSYQGKGIWSRMQDMVEEIALAEHVNEIGRLVQPDLLQALERRGYETDGFFATKKIDSKVRDEILLRKSERESVNHVKDFLDDKPKDTPKLKDELERTQENLEKVPQSIQDARNSITNRDFEAFDELSRKWGRDNPWVQKLIQEGVEAGVNPHNLGSSEVFSRNQLREEAEKWEQEKQNEIRFREKHPRRARYRDFKEKIDRGRVHTKVGEKNPYDRMLTSKQERDNQWKVGDPEQPPVYTTPDNYVSPADQYYNVGGPEPELGIERDESGTPFYSDPYVTKTGLPTTHTPGEPWRPENSKGMAGRMREISDGEWARSGAEELIMRDILKEVQEEIVREKSNPKPKKELKQKDDSKKKDVQKPQKEIEKKPIEKKQSKPEMKTDKETGKPKVAPEGKSDRKSDDSTKQPTDTKEKQLEDKPQGEPESKQPPSQETPTGEPRDVGPSLWDRARERYHERRQNQPDQNAGYEPYDPHANEPGLGARAGAALRQKLIDMRNGNNGNEPNSIPDNDWGGVTADEFARTIQQMPMSQLRDAVQRAAVSSGNVSSFMSTDLGNGRTIGDYYSEIERATSEERGRGNDYIAPTTISEGEKQTIMEKVEDSATTHSERALDPDPTALTSNDEKAGEALREILSK